MFWCDFKLSQRERLTFVLNKMCRLAEVDFASTAREGVPVTRSCSRLSGSDRSTLHLRLLDLTSNIYFENAKMHFCTSVWASFHLYFSRMFQKKVWKKKKTFHCIRLKHFEMGVLGTNLLCNNEKKTAAAAAISQCALSPCHVLPSIGKNTSPCAGGESGVPGSDNRWRPVSDDCLVMICDTVRVLVCGDPPRNTGFSWPRASLHT